MDTGNRAARLTFQPTLLHEERPNNAWSKLTQGIFQPTLLHEERPQLCPETAMPRQISTHAPARGATTTLDKRRYQEHNFNPRSCTRSDQLTSGSKGGMSLFQPTLLHEERPRADCMNSLSVDLFQPTLLHEERPPRFTEPSLIGLISTHAPARGATSCRHSTRRERCDFNPRSCTRSDPRPHPSQ